MSKKSLFAVALISAFAFCGCDEVPSADTVKTFSNMIGASAGMVVKLVGVDAETMNNINTVLSTVDKVVPDEDQTFEDAWTPFIDEGIQKLIDEGKVSETQAKLIKTGCSAAVKGLDRLFEKKPAWKKYDKIVVASVDGFLGGFRSVLTPVESTWRLATLAADPEEVKIIAQRVGVEL